MVKIDHFLEAGQNMHFLVCFLEDFKAWKTYFEIFWPLKTNKKLNWLGLLLVKFWIGEKLIPTRFSHQNCQRRFTREKDFIWNLWHQNIVLEVCNFWPRGRSCGPRNYFSSWGHLRHRVKSSFIWFFMRALHW